MIPLADVASSELSASDSRSRIIAGAVARLSISKREIDRVKEAYGPVGAVIRIVWCLLQLTILAFMIVIERAQTRTL
jgi:hypothetical protein